MLALKKASVRIVYSARLQEKAEEDFQLFSRRRPEYAVRSIETKTGSFQSQHSLRKKRKKRGRIFYIVVPASPLLLIVDSDP